jgi:hypothetical protein
VSLFFHPRLTCCRDEQAGDAEFDVGNLTVVQPSLQEEPGVLQDSADAIKSIASRLTQCLINRVFSLPSTPLPGGKLVQLPEPLMRLPRGKPIPKPKPLTKWEKFAKEKGIVKKKRSKLAFDEATQDWKRIHGYDKANDALAVPIIEASDKDKVLPLSPDSIPYYIYQRNIALVSVIAVLHALQEIWVAFLLKKLLSEALLQAELQKEGQEPE